MFINLCKLTQINSKKYIFLFCSKLFKGSEMKKSLVAILGVVLLLCCSVRAQSGDNNNYTTNYTTDDNDTYVNPDDDDLYSKAVIKLEQFQAAVRSN